MKKQIGSLYLILSAVLFGMMPFLAKIAYSHGGNAYTVAFGRFFFGCIMLGIVKIIGFLCFNADFALCILQLH